MGTNIVVKIYDTRKQMGEAGAMIVSEKINGLLTTKNEINMVFAAAPSQNEFLASLTQKEVDWSRVNAFHMDEYLGLEKDAPQAFGNFLKEKLFEKLPFKNIHYINGSAANITYECQRYQSLLENNPPDIVCMGIGENGHIAFNDPPVADFNDPVLVKMVALDQACRQQQVNDGCFATLNEVPLNALTLTIPALMRATYVYCIVPGELKATAVYNTLYQQRSERYPSTILREHPSAILFLDKESSKNLNK